MGLGYPGGPIIDRLARQGNPKAYTFSKPHISGLDYSFSGLKTSFLYSLRDWMKEDPDFIEHHKSDLAASLEATVVDILMDKLRKAAKQYKINNDAIFRYHCLTFIQRIHRYFSRQYPFYVFKDSLAKDQSGTEVFAKSLFGNIIFGGSQAPCH